MIDEAERAITWASQYKMYMLPWKCEAPEQGFEKCNFGHLSGLANCSSELRVPFLGDPHHKIYVVVVRRQVFKTATLAGGLALALLHAHNQMISCACSAELLLQSACTVDNGSVT